MERQPLVRLRCGIIAQDLARGRDATKQRGACEVEPRTCWTRSDRVRQFNRKGQDSLDSLNVKISENDKTNW